MNNSATPRFVISGTVLPLSGNASTAGLRIELWDKSQRCPDVVDCAVSDARGRFQLVLEEAYLLRVFPSGRAELSFRVFQGTDRVVSPDETVVWAPGARIVDVVLRVDLGATRVPGSTPAQSVVRGRVAHATLGPAEGLSVRAFDRNLVDGGFRDDLLGTATTDARGCYQIRYRLASSAPQGKVKADLWIEAFGTIGTLVATPPGPPLDETEVACHAPTIAEVNLVVEGTVYRLSEVEDLSARIAPTLAAGEVELADVDDGEQLAHLACSAGVDQERLDMLRRASKVARDTGVSAFLIYALARVNIATDVRALLSHPIPVLRAAAERAIGRNIVPASLGDALDDALAELQAALMSVVFSDPPPPDAAAIRGLLAASLSSLEIQQAFLTHYHSFDGPIAAFWIYLQTQSGFESPSVIEDLKLTHHIGLLTHNNAPLMQQIRALRVAETVQSLRDLTAYDADGWHDLLMDARAPGEEDPPVPPHLPGATIEERTSNYIAAMLDALGTLFPTKYLRQRYAQAPEVDLASIRAILAANPGLSPTQPLPADADHGGVSEWEQARASWEVFRSEIRAFPAFDYAALLESSEESFDNPIRNGVTTFLSLPFFELTTTPLQAYLAEHPEHLEGVPTEHRPAVIAQLEATQRVARITPRAEHVVALLGAGLDSARRIARMPKGPFVEQFADALGGAAQAEAVLGKAKSLAAAVQIVSTTTRQATVESAPLVIGGETPPQGTAPPEGAPPEDTGIPDLAALFGALELCECQHCRSVYSPAAYFVDLLHGLDPDGWNVFDAEGHPVPKPVDVLFARRPDLQHILLTCENTNTPLPYIDLVNEILESYIEVRYHDSGVPPFSLVARDTGKATAAELRAVPQYVIDEAYLELEEAVYPSSLPFHRPLQTVRTYLQHLGTSRHEVMKTFRQPGLVDDAHVLAEELGLSFEEYQIIIGATLSPPHALREFYGYGADMVPDPDADPEADPPVLETFQENLSRVRELLARTGTSYVDLVALVKTWFVNRDQSVEEDRMELVSSTDDCDLDHMHVTHLDDTAIGRLHRFLRLQRRLGWSIPDLDRALFALGATDIDETALGKIADVARLAAELRRPVVEILSFWSKIDTWNDDSLYVRKFQNRAVANTADLDAFKLEYPFSSGSPAAPDPNIKSGDTLPNLPTPQGQIKDHVPAILAALEITAPDLDSLLESAGLDMDSDLEVESLSRLYRRALLAKALKMRIGDLVLLLGFRETWNASPGSPDDPFMANDPAAMIDLVRVARDVKASGFSVPLLDYLYRDTAESANVEAPAPDRIAAVLAAIRSALLGVLAEVPATFGTTGDVLRSKLLLVLDPGLIDAAAAVLDPLTDLPLGDRTSAATAYFSSFMAPAAINALATAVDAAKTAAGTPPDEDIVAAALSAAIGVVLQALTPYLRDKLGRNAVVEGLASALALDTSLTRTLIESILTSKVVAGGAAMEDFLLLGGPGLTGEYFAGPDLEGSPPEEAPVLKQIDAQVSFNWTADAPPPVAMDGDRCSARWTGNVLPSSGGSHTFYLRTDGGVRLWIGGVPLIDEWTQPEEGEIVEHMGTSVELAADTLHPIKIEYTNQSDSGVLTLSWSTPSTPKSVVPEGQLFPDLTPNPAIVELFAVSKTYRLLHKAARLVGGLALTEREVVHLDANGDLFGFALDALPLAPSSEPSAGFDGWRHVRDLVALRDRLPKAEKTFIDLFELDPAAPGAPAMLAEITGWDEPLIAAIVGENGLDLAEGDFHMELRLLDLEACVRLCRRTGLAPEKLFSWASSAADAPQSRSVVEAVKARHEGDAWLPVAESLNDTLRQERRSALVAYLVGRLRPEGIHDENGLFEHFLIDVEMCACMATSRIKQAISSVQLFVQRCLLNLEREVSPGHIDAEQWKWRKSYRIWEANRKVFLYPENWIEPELRSGKSPFFRELETELLQQDLTDESAELAIGHYLEKLDDVALLEPCGLYWQEEKDGGIDVLHVFARTVNAPRTYFYRRFVEHHEWTPWERVDVDIQGDHLIPVVHNRRLYLFWPTFSTVPLSNQPAGKTDGTNVTPTTRIEITLAWSEYRSGAWAPKRVSATALSSTDFAKTWGEGSGFGKPTLADHVFRVLIKDSQLYIHVRRYSTADVPRLLGSFWMDDCHDTLRTTTNPPTVGKQVEKLTTLQDAAVHAMSFLVAFDYVPDFVSPDKIAEGDDGTSDVLESYNVTFLDTVGAGTDVHKVLVDMPYEYRLLYPAQIENLTLPSSFGALYPFILQDRRRAYFGLPVIKNEASATSAKQGKVAGAIEKANPSVFFTSDMFLAPASEGGDYMPSDPGALGLALGFYGSGAAELANPYLDVAFTYTEPTLAFSTFCHPFACAFIEALKHDGVPGLLTLANQKLSSEPASPPPSFFELTYHPTSEVASPRPRDDVSFEIGGAYSLYNWELFFHAPLLIATQLSSNQRYEDAQRWFHYIFDPTTHSTDPSPERFWNVRPFHENTEYERAQDLLALLSYPGSDLDMLARKQKVIDQVAVWEKYPFDPHRIAQLRLVAYQKTVVMKYIDNLIAWGDQLFSRDTLETINEATQLYVLAARILGPRPERVQSKGDAASLTYFDMRGKLDKFSDLAVKLENVAFPFDIEAPPDGGGGIESILAAGDTLYFCTPRNDVLLKYWDTVADRLFKIRNCMNLEGVVRQLPLFEPPIDPAVLVRAVAAGVDLASVVADLNAPLSHYRFTYMLQKAMELAGELKSFGGALLAALEKKDGEELSMLRSTHEKSMLEAVRDVKRKQIDEAQAAVEALSRTRAVTSERHKYYDTIKERIAEEKAHIALLGKANEFQGKASSTEQGVAQAAQIPSFATGTSGMASPVVTATFGGINVVAMLQSHRIELTGFATSASYLANLASIKGGWSRRSDDWKLQERLSKLELTQIDKQIEAARIRLEIAQTDLRNTELQIENATAVEDFLRNKYTNRELYGWMVTQVATLYFRTYKLAYDMAKRAERAYRFERGLTSSGFIQFGYWDSLKKGLLAGERLALDLKRLEGAYLDQNRREHEITTHVSLVLHDPTRLMELKTTGACEIELPEELFDSDYPGHYCRRIKSVSITIPCVAGPYTGVNCTLTLLSSKIRVDGGAGGTYAEEGENSDPRFLYNFAATESIATSHAQNDAGMFELNFRDERYLPFEGSGAVSRFRIELPKENNAFDFDTISDVVLRINYTARPGGELLKAAAKSSLEELRKALPGGEDAALEPPLQRLFSARHEFPTAWHHFKNPAPGAPPVLSLLLDADRYSYLFRGKDIAVTKVDLYLLADDEASLGVAPPGADLPSTATEPLSGGSGVYRLTKTYGDPGKSGTGTWTIKASAALPESARDLILIFSYAVTDP